MFDKLSRQFYKKYFFSFLLGVLILIGVDYIQLELPKIVKKIVNALETGTILTDKTLIADTTIRILVLAALMFIGRYLWRFFLLGVGIKIEYDIRNQLFKQTKDLDQEFYDKHKTGALMAYYTNDLGILRDVYGRGTMMIIDFAFLGVLVIVELFKISWLLTTITLGLLLIFMSFFSLIQKKINKSFKAKQESYEKLSEFTQENFQGIRVIKGFVKEEKQTDLFNHYNTDNFNKDYKFTKYSIYSDILMQVLSMIIFGTIICVGMWFVIDHKIKDVGSFIQYILLFDTLVWPLSAIGMYITLSAQAKAAMKRVKSLLDAKNKLIDKEKTDTIRSGKIEFKNFNFKFSDSDRLILNNLNLVIKPGETVGILGRTGSGKSTITDIITRIHNVEPNTLFIDDKDIMDLNIEHVRDNIKTVTQDNFVFNKTIRENIAFGTNNLTSDSKINHVVEISELKSAIESFEEGLDKIAGEKGTKLSGGQKQRTTIARALISDPLILILDDSMSALDIKTERKILANLKIERKDKTTILISHRTQTVKDLDKIIVLDEGVIKGIGTHKELLETSSTYKTMYELQNAKGGLVIEE